VGPFEEEEEGTGVASDVVKVEGEDPDTPGYLRGDRVRPSWDVGDLGSWVRLPWLAHGEAPGPYIMIPQYWFHKTKQHTHTLDAGRDVQKKLHFGTEIDVLYCPHHYFDQVLRQRKKNSWGSNLRDHMGEIVIAGLIIGFQAHFHVTLLVFDPYSNSYFNLDYINCPARHRGQPQVVGGGKS